MTNENLPTINYDDPKMVATLKSTVAQGLTNEEFVLFAQFCQSTGLNPFKKEIWAIKAGNRLQLMTGINGFFAIANANPLFDGYESGLLDPNGQLVSAAYPGNDFIGAWCRVHRKDRKIPAEAIAFLAEYDKKQSTWNTQKRVMITKCAESMALRKAFPQQLNGLYTAEEMPLEYSEPKPVARSIDDLSIPPKPTIKMQLETTTAIGNGTAFQYDTKRAGANIAPDQKKIMLGRLEKQYGLVFKDGFGWTSKAIPEWSEYLMNDPREPEVVVEKPKKASKDKRTLAVTPPVEDDIPADWGKEEEDFEDVYLKPDRFEVTK